MAVLGAPVHVDHDGLGPGAAGATGGRQDGAGIGDSHRPGMRRSKAVGVLGGGDEADGDAPGAQKGWATSGRPRPAAGVPNPSPIEGPHRRLDAGLAVVESVIRCRAADVGAGRPDCAGQRRRGAKAWVASRRPAADRMLDVAQRQVGLADEGADPVPPIRSIRNSIALSVTVPAYRDPKRSAARDHPDSREVALVAALDPMNPTPPLMAQTQADRQGRPSRGHRGPSGRRPGRWPAASGARSRGRPEPRTGSPATASP